MALAAGNVLLITRMFHALVFDTNDSFENGEVYVNYRENMRNYDTIQRMRVSRWRTILYNCIHMYNAYTYVRV